MPERPTHTAESRSTALVLPAAKEARCKACRGFGWLITATPNPLAVLDRRTTVAVCRCIAGERFWQLALGDGEAVCGLMGLDGRGLIASTDGLFAKSPVGHREVQAWRASSPTSTDVGVRS